MKSSLNRNLLGFHNQIAVLFYLRVTEAPAASSFSLISLASASEAPSLITDGALSTIALASLRPSPVISRTTLITPTFLSPAAVNSTSNESLAAAASPPAAAAATGAAAVTPNSSSIAFTRSLSSRIVASLISAIIFSMFNAIVISSKNMF
ncbi:conserved hypothetical protein [Streptococcus agalactiae COH1]|nr:conserved hypothetical protein [Streptococcus agalactiae COH1]